ncbi:hypothetical protein LMG33818_000044 [Halomonadaceae bacterium LMG 33818]|uniref:hypothetical protein n=1 Tax=Cernens ardua TaxID=3402176 RepID=UPI003EDC7656
MASTVHVRANLPRGHVFRLKSGKEIRINGNANHLIGMEKGILPIGQYGITEMPVTDWEAIKAEFGKTRLLKEGLVFAQDTAAKARDQANEQEELRHGLEAADKTSGVTREAPADAA